MEGCFVSGQLFGSGGPAIHLVEVARQLIDSSVPAEYSVVTCTLWHNRAEAGGVKQR